MIRLTYIVTPENVTDEVDWLRQMGVFPARREGYNYTTYKPEITLGMIVSSEAVMTIKLRGRGAQMKQEPYRRK